MIRKILLGIGILTFANYFDVYALDATTAHPWIAENAAFIWPGFPKEFINPDGTFNCQAILNNGTQEQKEFSFCPNLGFGFLGQYNRANNSGAFTDVCTDTLLSTLVGGEPLREPFRSMLDRLLKVQSLGCTGKSIVEGSAKK